MTHLLRASWNWWVATAVVAVLIFAIGSRIDVETNPKGADLQRVALSKTESDVQPSDGSSTVTGAPRLKRNEPRLAAAAPPAEVRGATARSVLEQRQIARKAFVSLIVPDVDGALAALAAATRASGGDITKLDDERPASANERHAADATAIVPQGRLDSVLKRITQLGDVRSETISAEDVTDQLVDSQARLRNLRRSEADTLKIMDRSGRISEILEVQSQLSDIRDQIEKLDAETHAVAARVATSTIDVHFEDAVTATLAQPSVTTTLGNAWRGAWQSSRDAAVALVARSFYLLAFAPYWLVPLAMIGLIVIRANRMRAALRP